MTPARIEADQLPPAPLHLSQSWGWLNKIRLGRDYYVRLDTGDYLFLTLPRLEPTATAAAVADPAAELGVTWTPPPLHAVTGEA